MPLQRKRHNPEITKEDLAAQAFDRNNDAGLEDKIQAEKGNLALAQEFCQLITEVFGKDIHLYNYDSDYRSGFEHKFDPLNEAGQNKSAEEQWELYKLKRKESFFRPAKGERYISITPISVPTEGAEGRVGQRDTLPIFENRKFNPIKIITYTPEALSKAKNFVKAYKSMTGQDVTLVQEFADKEEVKKHLQEDSDSAVEDMFKDLNELNIEAKIKSERRRFKRNLFRGLLYGACGINSLLAATSQYEKGNTKETLFFGGITLLWGFIAWAWYKDETSRYEKFLNETYKK